MKLNKLQIFNIASIASIHDATTHIDKPQEIFFDESPLLDSDVYLITGDTGAGKSTILDAMCLALFNNTPRMNTKKNSSVQMGVDNLTLRDPRRLMRQNTGEAYVKLYFTGIDGNEYVAEWHVQRGITKRTTSKMDQVSRSLENITKGEIITSSNTKQEKEFQEKIYAAIGLDFDQFCRTTMLAQGDFTRFLSSSEDERAEILEKITKTEKFAQAGAKIYEIITQKEKEWTTAQEAAGQTGLSQEEINAKNDEKTRLESANQTQKEEKETATKKQNWLSENDSLLSKQRHAQQEYDEAKALLVSDEYQQKSLFVSQWNATIDARSWLNLMEMAKRNEEEALKALAKMKTPFIGILNGQRFVIDKAKKDKAEFDSINAFLESEKTRGPMYANAQTIAGHLQTIFDGRKKINEYTGNITREEKYRDETLIPAQQQANEALDSAVKADEKLKNEINNKQKDLDDLNITDLNTEKDQINGALLDIKQAITDLNTLESTKQNWADETKRLKKVKDGLDATRKKLDDEIIPKYNIAKSEKERCEKVLESLKDSVDKFAKQMRVKLTVGCECPVCRQKVEALPIEETLDQLYSTAQNEFNDAKSKLESSEQLKNETESQYNTEKKRYDQDLEKHDSDTSVSDAQKTALASCQKVGIHQLSDDTKVILEDQQTKKKARLDEIKPIINQGSAIETELRTLRDQLQNHSQVEAKKAAFDAAKQLVGDCNTRIQTTNELMAGKEIDIKNAQNATEPLIAENEWMIDWRSNPDLFKTKLLTAAIEYNEKNRTKTDLELRINTAKTAISTVDETIQHIRKQMPNWDSMTETASIEMANLAGQSTTLLSEICAQKNSLTDAIRRKDENGNQLSEFLKNNPGLTVERLKVLGQANSVSEISKVLHEISTNEQTKKKLLDDAKKNFDSHQISKPKITEDESIEALSNVIRNAEIAIDENNQKIGVINKELTDDIDLKAKLGALKKAEEDARKEFEKWNRLSPFSDKEGKKFRKIAQSLIFESLLDSANYYLNKLEPRYTLKVVPGTLYSSLEDAYQGFAERDTGSLSGGESFLVSLALALALSEIGQGLEVDTLFIDEGFGSLSGIPLANAINTLRTLRGKKGRHVGVISHIQEVRDNIPVQIQVTKTVDDSSSLIEVKVVQ